MRLNYINLSTANPRDQVTIRGLSEMGAVIKSVEDNSTGLKKFWHLAQKILKAEAPDLVIVGYTGAILVPLVKVLTRRPVIYNTLGSFYESMIISRKVAGPWSVKGWKYWLIDWLAFKLSTLILVESEAQKKYLIETFRLPPQVVIVHLTGVDDRQFYFDSSIAKDPVFTVLFRGKFLPEAGVDIILNAAKALETDNVKFRIIGHGLLQAEIISLANKLNLSNTELITAYLPQDQLRVKMLSCHLALGQLANHDRLKRTIPHKAFESLALRLPYLTGRQKVLGEILTDQENCWMVNPGDPNDLVAAIRELKNRPEVLEHLAASGYELYQASLTPAKLGKKLMDRLQVLIKTNS